MTVNLQLSERKCNLKRYQEAIECAANISQHLVIRTQFTKEIKYPCDICDYQATVKGDLKIHKESKHFGVKHPCSLCDYQATHKNSLTRYRKIHL